jgi:hypothetical protein
MGLQVAIVLTACVQNQERARLAPYLGKIEVANSSSRSPRISRSAFARNKSRRKQAPFGGRILVGGWILADG